MLKISKILSCVVIVFTIISLIILFYPFIPQKWINFITLHRVKSALTLLSPIIFGAITAYIAYQQHCLAKTQANISRDQRDIAHNKLRVENFEKIYQIHSHFSDLYVKIFNFPRLAPHEFENEFNYERVKKVSELTDEKFSQELRSWTAEYIEEEKIIDDMLSLCWLEQQKCKFLFDDDTYHTIFKYMQNCQKLFDIKKESISEQIRFPYERSYADLCADINTDHHCLILEVNGKMNRFINISDIVCNNIKISPIT